MPRGLVYLIGAGPGDPGLITVAGADALRRADVVVYDRLAHPSLLDYAPASAERIYVGKQADRHAMRQGDINALLAERAAAGQTVARLKGGDPFVFGRGGEEAEYLRERGFAFEIIPGVTSAIAGPAYAGIPVTHRDAASSFAVITGHERDDAGEAGTRTPGDAEGRRRWERIAHAADTLIFLMGVENLIQIVTKLVENGRDPSTPVALVRWATWAGRQRTLVGTLATIVDDVRQAGFTAPAVTVVGDVVNLRERLRWFDIGPLAGKRIVVTRAREQASDFAAMLRRLHAEPIEFPTIKIQPLSTHERQAIDQALMRLKEFDWLVFTSAQAVHAVLGRMNGHGLDSRTLGYLRQGIGVVGPSTFEALKGYGVEADCEPHGSTAADLAAELPGSDQNPVFPKPGSVLYPHSAISEKQLVEGLERRGFAVEAVVAYETVVDGAGADAVRERLAEAGVDIVTFTSSSTVKNFRDALALEEWPAGVTAACIGPSTAKTYEELFERPPDVVAGTHTLEGLVEALEKHFTSD